MNYIVYDTTPGSSSVREKDILWSVLLFGEKIHVISNYSLIIITYSNFTHYSFEEKLFVYELFKPMIEKFISWDELISVMDEIRSLRKKKLRTSFEQKHLTGREVWLRENEKWFTISLRDNLAKYHYEELALLDEDELNVTWAVPEIVENPLSLPLEKPVDIIADALTQYDNLFVFDESILPFITNNSFTKYTGQNLNQSDKAVAFSEKILNIPLCFDLKVNDIQLARNELTIQAKWLEQCIKSIFNSDVGGMRQKLDSQLPMMQKIIDDNTYISKARNQQVDFEIVNLHLAFTSARGILTILRKLGMLTDEELLQAGEKIQNKGGLNALHAFMYITH